MADKPDPIAALFDRDAPPDAPEWQAFPEDSGSLSVPRVSMPQIKSEHRGAMVQFLKGRGITHSQEEVAPDTLKPSQAEFSPEKVAKARTFEGPSRSILVSADNHVLDGHHQWLADLHDAPDEPIPVIRFHAPAQQLLVEAARFPSSSVDEQSAGSGAPVAPAPAPAPQPDAPASGDISHLFDDPASAPDVDGQRLKLAGARRSLAVARVKLRRAKSSGATPEEIDDHAQAVAAASAEHRQHRNTLEGMIFAPRPATPSPAAPANPYGAFDAQTEGRWSINDAPKVKDWYRQTFRRDLPVTAEGQSATHNSMGLDHSDSLDVGINGASEEGKALREYLRAQGIPFLAYDRAVPGAATAPHIHIGFPSHRGEAGEAARAGSIENLFDSGPDPLAQLFDPALAADPERRQLEEETGGPIETINAAPRVDASPAPLAHTPLDLQTMEGRAARDDSRALAHKPGSFVEVAAPLPSGSKAWNEVKGGDAVSSGVMEWAKQNGVDPAYARDWMSRNAPGGYSLYSHDGRPVESAADVLSSDDYDSKSNTLRVKLDASHLAKLKDDFDASKSTLRRVGDWASSDMESPGEKVLDVAAPVAGAVGKVGGYVARPFQAASASVFAALRGENPLTEAAHTFETGEHTDKGSNPIGNFFRENQTLARINPRLGHLLGAAADVIVDPSNLLGAGLLGKGAKIVAGMRAADEVAAASRSLSLLGEVGEIAEAAQSAEKGADVAALEDRLARVTETARKLRAGETLTPEEAMLYAEVQAKHAPAVESEVLKYARERAEFYTREAARSPNRTARANAQALADEYTMETARLEGGAGAGVDVAASSGGAVSSSEPSLLRRAARTAVDVAQLPKAKAGFDLSGTGRQALPQILAHPSYLKEAMAEQVKAFASEDAFNNFVGSIRGRDDFELMQRSGLYLSSAGSGPEENFASGLVKRIPGIKGSERAYSAALDSVRVQAWDAYTSAIADNPHVTPETHKAIADLINISTGRGVVPILDRSALGKKIIKALNVPFFSPRNTAAKFNLLSPARIVRNALDPATRPVALLQMRDATRGLVVLGTTLGLAHLAGADVGLNPFSNDFGQLRVGHAVYDLTGGESASVRWMAQMSRSFYRLERGKKVQHSQTPVALTRHYLRSQLQPAASVVVDKVAGETYEGEPATYTRAAADLVTPFVVDDFYKGWLDAGGSSVSDVTSGKEFKTAFKGATRAVPGIFGVGTNFYAKKGGRGSTVPTRPASIDLTGAGHR
jgi:hypothetical protein